MSERDAWRGQLATAEAELDRYQTLWDGKVKSLRNELDPLTPVEEIDTKLIGLYANDLALLQKNFEAKRKLIDKLNKQLNG